MLPVLNATPIAENAAYVFGEVNVFDIFVYTLYTKSTIVLRLPKGKWYFPSRLKIPKRVKSSNRKMCVVCGVKVMVAS
jgi:hypothetical protein